MRYLITIILMKLSRICYWLADIVDPEHYRDTIQKERRSGIPKDS